MDGGPLAEKIGRADAQPGRGVLIFDILRRAAQYAAGVEAIVRPDGRVAGEINVRPEAAARPQRHVAINDREGTDFDGGIQLGARADDGRGWTTSCSRSPPMAGLTCAAAVRVHGARRWPPGHRVEPQAQARLVPIGAGAMHDPGLGRLVQRGTEQPQGVGGVLFFARAQKLGVFAFQGVEAGFDALVLQMLARAASSCLFGIRHN